MSTKKLIIFIFTIIILSTAVLYLYTVPSIQKKLTLATSFTANSNTELYFEDQENLPKRTLLDREYKFNFTIHNLEGTDMNYNYEFYIEADGVKHTLETKSVFIKKNDFKTTKESFILTQPVTRAKVVINLINKNKSIDFLLEK